MILKRSSNFFILLSFFKQYFVDCGFHIMNSNPTHLSILWLPPFDYATTPKTKLKQNQKNK